MPRPIPNGGKGRPKGTLNKQPRAIKDMILASLDEVGGKDYLVRQATENPVAYMGLLGKIIPLQLTGENGGAIIIRSSPTDDKL